MKKKTISVSRIGAMLLSVMFYYISLHLYQIYYSGDLVAYRGFFDALFSSEYLDVPSLQFSYTGSSEPVYGLISWVGAKVGFEHDAYMALYNSALIFFLADWLVKNRVNKFVFFLVFTNYYLIVMLTGAERLKFSYFFILISFFVFDRRKKNLFYVASVGAHFQTLIVYISLALPFIVGFLRGQALRKKITGVIFFVILLIFLYLNFSEAVGTKFQVYAKSNISLDDVFNILILFGAVLYLFSARMKNVVVYSGFLFFVLLFGSDRVNMIAVSYFIYSGVEERRTSSVIFIGIMLYFSYKTILFYANIESCGNGFCV